MAWERGEKAGIGVAGYAITLLLGPILLVTQAILCLPWAVLGCFGFDPFDEG